MFIILHQYTKHLVTALSSSTKQQRSECCQVLQMKVITIFLSIIAFAFGFTPEIIELQLEIAELEARSNQLEYKRCHNTDVQLQDQHSIEISKNPLTFAQKCSFNQSHLQTFFMQSTTQIYLLINYPTLDLTKIYNSQCLELCILQNIQIGKILSDRGHIQSGLAFFIAKDGYLYQMIEEGAFKSRVQIANLAQQADIVGGVVRYRGKEKAQIFIIYEDGAVRVYEQSGERKLSFTLGTNNMHIQYLVDRHPYPLISSSSDWIILLDTTKYGEIQQICPHIPNVKAIAIQTHFNDVVYLLTLEKIYVLSLQHIKRQCNIINQFFLEPALSKITKVQYFSNALYIDDKIFNFTQKQLYRYSQCKGELSHQFVIKKNQPDQTYAVRKCCEPQNCVVEFGRISKKLQDKRIFLWMCICFAIVILVSLSFMKKSAVSNLDIDESLQYKERHLDRHIYERNRQKGAKSAKDKRK